MSWLQLAPRTAISRGQPLPRKKRNNGLEATRIAHVLRMAAVSLQRSKTALGAESRRKARHKGMKIAIFATARKLARLVYRMLRWGHDYVDIGEAAYESQFRERTLYNLQRIAKSLGYELVTKQTAEPGPELAAS